MPHFHTKMLACHGLCHRRVQLKLNFRVVVKTGAEGLGLGCGKECVRGEAGEKLIQGLATTQLCVESILFPFSSGGG